MSFIARSGDDECHVDHAEQSIDEPQYEKALHFEGNSSVDGVT